MASEPVALELAWEAEERFRGRAGSVELTLDGASVRGPSPVQALAFGLAGCMAIDIVDILTKGRVPPTGLRALLRGERAAEPPRRLVKVDLRFEVRGAVPADRVERAVALSREKYCSVWHSLRPDIELSTSFTLAP